MSEPIKAGDLCVVVKTCCVTRDKEQLGRIGRAIPKEPGSLCSACGHYDSGQHFAFSDGRRGAPAWWLKRIPPLSELEGEKRDEEIHA